MLIRLPMPYGPPTPPVLTSQQLAWGQEDCGGGAAHLRRGGFFDVFERVRAARVLGDAVVVQVDQSRDRIVGDVFENRPELACAGVDLWLRRGRKLDHLGVAAALEVEHSLVAPAVLVIANQAPLRVGREGGLARARESEEYRHVVVGPAGG